MFLVLQIPAFRVPGFTDSGFSCSWFYRFRLFVFLVLQIPAFRVPGFTDSGFSCSWFYRFRFFVFLVLQIPAFRVPGFLVPRSVPRSVPRFPVPCFTDSHYSTTEKEAFAIQFGAQHFRVYLVGRKFTIIMDHNALKWLNQIKPKGRVARWLMDLQEFDFIVKYRSGRVHNNADALSRLLPCQHQVNNKPSADVTLETLRNKILV